MWLNRPSLVAQGWLDWLRRRVVGHPVLGWNDWRRRRSVDSKQRLHPTSYILTCAQVKKIVNRKESEVASKESSLLSQVNRIRLASDIC